MNSGSPPRVWGILRDEYERAIYDRFTPTCVGNTQVTELSSHTVARFTPTCVGNTHWLVRSCRLLSGSPPRVWGIRHTARASMCHQAYGSPPRVWGIPFCNKRKIDRLGTAHKLNAFVLNDLASSITKDTHSKMLLIVG